MKGKEIVVGMVVVLGMLALGGCAPVEVEEPSEPAEIGLPNPASVYCEEQGGTVEMRTDEEGDQYGVCVFEDGSECEEWAFFRGECSPGTQDAD